MRILTLAAAPAFLVLIACSDEPGAVARNVSGELLPTQGGSGAAALPTDAPQYLASAASGDQYEIQSSRLVEEARPDPNVRQFAQMMIQHHTRTTQTLTAAAKSAGNTPPPPALLPKHAMLIEQLRAQQGPARQAAYLQQQRQAHEEALALHQAYAERGDTPALRQAAQAAVPIVQQHLVQLQELSSAR
jgi:putative membrane protein